MIYDDYLRNKLIPNQVIYVMENVHVCVSLSNMANVEHFYRLSTIERVCYCCDY